MPNSFEELPLRTTAAESTWRRRLAKWATTGAVAVALPAAAGFAARVWWIFELASHFRVQYFWSLLVATVALITLRRWRIGVLVGAFCALHAVLLWPFYAPSYRSQTARANFKIVSLNLYSGNRQFDDVLRFIRDESPDVAVFLEVNERWGDSLTALDGEWPYSRMRAQRGTFGVALFSKRPFEESRIEFLANGFPAVMARLNVETAGEPAPVTIFGTHPMRPMLGVGDAARNEQLAALAKLVTARSGATIVVGDLNTTSWSPGFSDFSERVGLVDSRLGLGVQPSWPSFLPLPFRIPIDHCLVSPGIRIADRRIGPDVGSDHLPVIVDLAIVAPDGS
ncbi:MAG TPA: endonuclease/exonuclease/phosphatase family protein [Planctomycetaceae bacterium]|nr:endonuclease/exonuclease/phosphatase family protein [Planctomycetaceae bacterium]